MARKLRLEFAGATYHVISRGNYRADVFGDEATKTAFLKCLGEACEKAGWVVHAWCVMSNHYHLCLETPSPNLVEGMRWLQATFSVRFNRFRDERGHVFQGRYKAILVDPEAIGAVGHYIHLNPVRARIVDGAMKLAAWPWTSSAGLMNPRQRPHWFSPVAVLDHAGGLPDTPDGRAKYLDYLAWLQEDDLARKQLQFDRLSKGWVVGSPEFKKELIIEHRHLAAALERGDADDEELAVGMWESRVRCYLDALDKTDGDLANDSKGATWKVAIAMAMKTRTTASNPWLAERLVMGSPFRLSRLVSAAREDPEPVAAALRRMAKCKV